MSEFKRRRVIERREQAIGRQERRDAISSLEQLRRLEARGHSHCREARILRTVT